MLIEKTSFMKCITYEDENIRKVISTIENGGLRIALVLNNHEKLVGTVCDGDIRRGLLKGLNLDSPISSIIQRNCITADINSSKKFISKMMKDNAISQIPIISENKKIIGLEISDDLLPKSSEFLIPNTALIMAGGRGSRLKPITNNCPKPLLPINGKPILEIILEQCINCGIRNIFISVNYLAEKIINYFGNGSKWDVKIEYLKEKKPLGTAGALNLLPNDIKNEIIIINGDVLTKTNFQDVLKYHSSNKADITVCAREHVISSPYGVIEVDGIYFKSMIEKPSLRQLVNAGIYVVNPSILKLIKQDKFIDMPELISLVKKNNNDVVVYPVHEYWIDIGKPETLDKAIYEWGGNKSKS